MSKRIVGLVMLVVGFAALVTSCEDLSREEVLTISASHKYAGEYEGTPLLVRLNTSREDTIYYDSDGEAYDTNEGEDTPTSFTISTMSLEEEQIIEGDLLAEGTWTGNKDGTFYITFTSFDSDVCDLSFLGTTAILCESKTVGGDGGIQITGLGWFSYEGTDIATVNH